MSVRDGPLPVNEIRAKAFIAMTNFALAAIESLCGHVDPCGEIPICEHERMLFRSPQGPQ
jgi:hypothetical protein